MEDKVSKEVAESDFEKMALAADVDTGGMDEEELEEFEATKRKFVRLIMRGKMEVDEAGLPTLFTGTELVPELKFRTPYSDVLIAQGRVLNENETAKSRAMIAASTGVAPKLFNKGVSGRDFITAQKIMNFFLVD